ncbi:citrate lyase holo-[acyl-carrier protein] synthase [Arsenicicoccus dermatophilus]|uniref:citrate lyase holo-[acyl-carrier protein] synthase n=1 Tax=Arsenicicoccus dermatophilus TaxID=1076331 RepID=UPI001F4CD29A|nr:citrate lyase holo-[acyl-carrier protein] synthase [Arsenicicoccus dermatophilus]MCH8612734.1 citrate lyase holo-[acyl-carrier protein] synthase [Arsenicicoccus dermatophilus]
MTSPTVPAGVDRLQAILDARDARATRRRELQRRHPAGTVVVVTLVIPGPDKDGPGWCDLGEEAVGSVLRLCARRGWALDARESVDAATGPETVLVVRAEPSELKSALVELEDSHPWGRLWDLDVHVGEMPLSRAALGAHPRRCLVCPRPAHACARSRAHPLTEVLAAVEVIRDRPRG